jgi:hypothetical protein
VPSVRESDAHVTIPRKNLDQDAVAATAETRKTIDAITAGNTGEALAAIDGTTTRSTS